MNHPTITWIIAAWLMLSMLITIARTGKTRTYTSFDAVAAVFEIGLAIVAVFYIAGAF